MTTFPEFSKKLFEDNKNVTGEVSQLSDGGEIILYSYIRTAEKRDNGIYIKGRYFDKKSGLPVVEISFSVTERGLEGFHLMQHQTGEEGMVTGDSNGELHISYGPKNSLVTSDEPYSPLFVIPAGVEFFVQLYWDHLLQGHIVRLRLADIEQLKSIPAKLEIKKDNKNNEIVEFELSPVHEEGFPVTTLCFHKKNRRVKEVVGLAYPKILEKGEWKRFKAKTKLFYPTLAEKIS